MQRLSLQALLSVRFRVLSSTEVSAFYRLVLGAHSIDFVRE